MEEYKPRITDEILDSKLRTKGAVVIDGPKWCGKTTSAEQFAKSVVEFGDPRTKEQNLSLLRINPEELLAGDTPLLFDEWQEAPTLWDILRHEIDKRNKVGQFILTGSSVKFPKGTDKDPRMHSGTGRYTYLFMRPMSLYESGESNGSVSLKKIFKGEDIFGKSDLSLDDLAFVTCRGGWPFSTLLKKSDSLSQAKDYYSSIINEDISRADGVKRDSRIAKKMMRSLARGQGQQISIESITKDVGDVSADTVSSYIDALRRVYVIEDAQAWNPNLRSKTAIRTSDTRYFVDPSIATASLGLGPEGLIGDLNYFGFVFETLAFRDLRVYTEPLEGEVYHYRDKNGLECDAVIVLPDGNYGLVQMKLGQTDDMISDAIEKMDKLVAKIDTEKMNLPSFKMVLTGNGKYAYRRPEDGVYVVPIGCLKP